MKDIEATEEYRAAERRHAINCALDVGLIAPDDEDGVVTSRAFMSFWYKFSADKDDLRRMVRQDLKTERREKQLIALVTLAGPFIAGVIASLSVRILLKWLSGW